MFENIHNLKSVPVDENLQGLQSISKVFSVDGSPAFLSKSKLDLDSDGKRNPKITRYDLDHQDQTSLDPSGAWLGSDNVCYIVLPGGFSDRHGGCQVGMLATVKYRSKMAHCVVADVGPRSKFGEGSIKLHETIDSSRIKAGRLLNIGIGADVEILWYIGSKISKTRFTQDDIDKEAKTYYDKFNA